MSSTTLTPLQLSTNGVKAQAWAYEIAEFDGGTQYGQSGNDPQPPEGFTQNWYTDDVAGLIKRLVRSGRKSAIARQNHDAAGADFHAEDKRRIRHILKPYGISADQIFSIGYQQAYRQIASYR